MRRCKITIELDRADTSYDLTEPVTGQVLVDVRRTTQCDELELSCTMKTHGRGDNYKREIEEINLFSGEWQPGQYAYPFRIPIDSEQASYHGELINVDWYLSAEADIPKSLDVKEEVDFLRVRESAAVFVGDEYKIASDMLDKKNSISKVGLLIFFLLVPALFIWPLLSPESMPEILKPVTDILFSHGVAIDGFLKNFDKGLFGLVFFVVLSVSGVTFLKYIIQKKSNQVLGRPMIEIENGNEAQPGERLRCVLGFTPTKSASVRHCRATLHGYERAVDTSGTTSSTYTHSLYEHTIDLPFHGGVTAGVPVERWFELEIPAGAPLSFNLGRNDLNWSVEMDMKLGKWLQWKGRRVVKVVAKDDSY